MEKEPCLEYGDKNVVKGQCPNCERPTVFTVIQLGWQKAKREIHGLRLSKENI